MAAGDSISSPLPTVSGSVDTWGTELNTYLDEIQSSIESAVPVGNLNINANLDMASRGIDSLKHAEFTDQSGTLGGGDERKLYTVSGDLYYTDHNGLSVRLTESGALSTVSVGSITSVGGPPDYGASGVELQWNNTNTEYRFFEGSNNYSDIRVEAVKFVGGANYVRLKAPSSPTTHDITLPSANPTSGTSLLQTTTGGIQSHTRDPSVATVTTTGLATLNSATVTSGLDIGAGDVTHTTRKKSVPACMAQPDSAYVYDASTATTDCWQYIAKSAGFWRAISLAGTNRRLDYPVPLRVGDTIESISMYIEYDTVDEFDIELWREDWNSGGAALVTGWGGTTPNGSGMNIYTLNGTDHVVIDEATYYVSVSANAAHTSSLDVGGLVISYKRV